LHQLKTANVILAVLALTSVLIALWQWLAARRFPLHRRSVGQSFAPAISLLKPLKGCDQTTAESLRSWFNQNYSGEIQILFGVARADDPVCEIVRKLIAENLRCDAQLVVCGELLGNNAKVGKLIQLEELAAHGLILISDADVRVPPDFLANFVTPLRDEKTGLVNCFYKLANPTTTAMQLEAVAINADFWSQVLQSQTLKPLDFALGAAILMRRKALVEIGGFNAIVNCLADDYQLGHRIAENGHHIALCPVIAECWDAPMDWRPVWNHQLRWARTIRACRPVSYFLSILSNATFWPLLWLVASLLFSKHFFIPLAALGLLTVRILIAQNLQRRFTQSRDIADWWLVPLKDLLQIALWAGAFSGNTIEWRGRQMRMCRAGNLVEVKVDGLPSRSS
jgi:ceramide glucosyltransferase